MIAKSFVKPLVLMLAAIGAPLLAIAAPTTYDFTGYVTAFSGYGGSVSVNELVSGTYSFDLANSQSNLSNLPVTQSDWYAGEESGTFFGMPTATPQVFTSTLGLGLNDGTMLYSSTAPGAYLSNSNIHGGPGYYTTNEYNYLDAATYKESLFELGTAGSYYPFTSDGLPLFTFQNEFGEGEVVTVNAQGTSYLQYNITSLEREPTMAPEITSSSSASGLTLLCGLVAVSRGRRSPRRRAQLLSKVA